MAIGRAVEDVVGERRGRPKAQDDAPSMFEEKRDNCPEFEAGTRTADVAAARAGFENRKAYDRAKTVVDEGASELVQAVDEDERKFASILSASATFARDGHQEAAQSVCRPLAGGAAYAPLH